MLNGYRIANGFRGTHRRRNRQKHFSAGEPETEGKEKAQTEREEAEAADERHGRGPARAPQGHRPESPTRSASRSPSLPPLLPPRSVPGPGRWVWAAGPEPGLVPSEPWVRRAGGK